MKWVVHPYTGCSHGCLYCYATSYIPRHSLVRAKNNFIERLRRDIDRIPKNILIEMSSSSDPYPSIESQYNLTRRTLFTLLSRGFKVLVLTKSSLIVKDLDVLKKFRNNVVVSITITTLDESIALRLEPGAPLPSERLRAIEILTQSGIKVVARIDPIIPLVNDDFNNIKKLVSELSKRGVLQITSSTYKARYDSLKRLTIVFPHIGEKLQEMYSKDSAENINGYRYLNISLRYNYMRIMKELVENEGIVFATCREGFRNLNTPGFECDGSSYLFID
jgi:DNA repair photolyase